MEINFKPILEYFDEFRAEVNQRFDHVESQLGNLETSVDNLSGQVKGFQEEMVFMNYRMGRMDQKLGTI